jgi:hypothetical protein
MAVGPSWVYGEQEWEFGIYPRQLVQYRPLVGPLEIYTDSASEGNGKNNISDSSVRSKHHRDLMNMY